jgi:hypothetical protein
LVDTGFGVLVAACVADSVGDDGSLVDVASGVEPQADKMIDAMKSRGRIFFMV